MKIKNKKFIKVLLSTGTWIAATFTSVKSLAIYYCTFECTNVTIDGVTYIGPKLSFSVSCPGPAGLGDCKVERGVYATRGQTGYGLGLGCSTNYEIVFFYSLFDSNKPICSVTGIKNK